MRSIPQCIKGTIAITVLFLAWFHSAEEDSMYYPENMPHQTNNPHSPDYSPKYGSCFACDHELVPEGDRLEPDLVCPNPRCEQSPHYVEE